MLSILIALSFGLFGLGVLPDAGTRPPEAFDSSGNAHDPQAVTHTYEVRIRLGGTVSKVRVQARDGGHAKKLVRAQYGPEVTVLSAKRID